MSGSKPILLPGQTCRRGHLIESASDVVVHGRTAIRFRCRKCVAEAHRKWVEQGRKARAASS